MFVFSFGLLFGGQKIFFVSRIIGFYRSKLQQITAQASQALPKVQHVRLYCKLAGFCCEGWDLLESIGVHTSEGFECCRASC